LLSQTPPSLVKVTTEEAVGVPQGVIDNTLIPSFQGIYDLMVKPGVDNVAMSFRTRQPINPFIKILNPDGERVDLFLTANKQQVHKIFLEGWDQPLAQETLHTYHIFADAMPGSWDPSRAEATGALPARERRRSSSTISSSATTAIPTQPENSSSTSLPQTPTQGN
jgi:hypothetical protein